MRLAFVSREYPPETGWGGIGTYVYHIAHALAAEGHDIHVISRSDRQEEYVRRDGQVTVHRIRERKWRGPWTDACYHLLPISERLYSRRVAEKVGELHQQKPFDLIEAPEYRAEAFELTRRRLAPVVVKLHTPTAVTHAANHVRWHLRDWLMDRMEAAATRRADAVSSPSRDLAEKVAVLWRLDVRSIRVFPYPIDLTRWTPQPYPTGEPVLLFVGRLEVRKGFAVLGAAWPQVAQRLPTARLVVVGNVDQSPLRTEWADRWQAAGCADRVTWVPWQDHAGLQAQYARAHVVVTPSLYENFPNVCLEAMASARPLVASRTGGIPEMVEDGVCGWLAPAGDAQALATLMTRALTDLRLSEAMGRAAAEQVAARFAPSHIAQRTAAYYQEVLGRAGSPDAYAMKRHIAYVFTDRWMDPTKPEPVLVHLIQRHEALRAQGATITWLRYQRSAQGWTHATLVQEIVQKFLEVFSTALDAWHIARQGRWAMRTVDVVHEWYSLYGIGGLLLSWWYRKPLIFEVDALLIEEYARLQRVIFGRWRRWWAHAILRANLRCARRVVVRSRVMAEALEREWHVPHEKLVILPLSVDVRRFRPDPSITLDPSLIVFVSSLTPWQGGDVLLDVFTEVHRQQPDATLAIVGDGTTRRQLEATCQARGLNGSVQFVGAVPHAEIPRWLQRAAVVVAPYRAVTTSWYFSPMKVFEYLGAGKAIVATRIGQVGEILTDRQTALLVEPNDVPTFANAVLELLRNPSLRERLGRAARELAESYTWDWQATQLLSLYDRVLNETRGYGHG